MDWHTGSNPSNLAWNQPAIRRGMKSSGFWAIDVRQPGNYQIRLRRWPAESKMKLGDSASNQSASKISRATLKIANHEISKEANPNHESVEFQIKLDSGQTELKADFLDASGNNLFGAYYVELLMTKP